MAAAFIKRKVNGVTERWDDAVTDGDVRRILEEVDVEVRKNDSARGKWSVRSNEARVWVDASSLAIGVVVEADGGVVEDASKLRKDDTTRINMAELDIKGLRT